MRNTTISPIASWTRGASLGFATLALLSLPAAADDTAAPADASQVGSIWWSELVSANPTRTRDFYAGVFGWTPKIVSADDTTRAPNPGEPEYTIFMHHGTEVAGAAAHDDKDPNEVRPGWLSYIQVANVDTAVLEAVNKGGKILKAPYDDAGTGRFAVVQDPDGTPVGLVTPISAAPIR